MILKWLVSTCAALALVVCPLAASAQTMDPPGRTAQERRDSKHAHFQIALGVLVLVVILAVTLLGGSEDGEPESP